MNCFFIICVAYLGFLRVLRTLEIIGPANAGPKRSLGVWVVVWGECLDQYYKHDTHGHGHGLGHGHGHGLGPGQIAIYMKDLGFTYKNQKNFTTYGDR